MLNIYICIEKIKVLLLLYLVVPGCTVFCCCCFFSGYSVLVKMEATLRVFIGGE